MPRLAAPPFATLPLAALALTALGLATAACGAPHLATVERAKTQLQGEALAALACIGEPLEQLTGATSDTTIWRFSSAQPRDPAGRTLVDPAQPAEAHSRACIADTHLRDGRITTVTTTNRAGWTPARSRTAPTTSPPAPPNCDRRQLTSRPRFDLCQGRLTLPLLASL